MINFSQCLMFLLTMTQMPAEFLAAEDVPAASSLLYRTQCGQADPEVR